MDGAFSAGGRPDGVVYQGAINRKAIAAQEGNNGNGDLRPPRRERRRGQAFGVNGNIKFGNVVRWCGLAKVGRGSFCLDLG